MREYQWRQKFAEKDSDWICIVVENRSKELVGFAYANRYNHDQNRFSGELNKIYLLWDYHRLGVGRQLFCRVVQRFLQKGIRSMILFSEPENPSGAFYKAMGGEKLLNEKKQFHGGWGWPDLTKLESLCQD